jgi:hypothetical protein
LLGIDNQEAACAWIDQLHIHKAKLRSLTEQRLLVPAKG